MRKLLLPILAAVLTAIGCATEPLAQESQGRPQTRTGGLWQDVISSTSGLPKVDYPTNKQQEAIHRAAYAAALGRVYAPQNGMEIWNKVSGFFYAWSELCDFYETNSMSTNSNNDFTNLEQALEWLRSQNSTANAISSQAAANTPAGLREEGYNDIVATYHYVLEKNVLYDFNHTPLFWRQAMLQLIIQDLWGGTPAEASQAWIEYQTNAPYIKETLDYQSPSTSRYKSYLPCFSHKDAWAYIESNYTWGEVIYDFGDLAQNIFPSITGSASLEDVFDLLDGLSDRHFNTSDMDTDGFRNSMTGFYTAAAFIYDFEEFVEEVTFMAVPDKSPINCKGEEVTIYITSNTNWRVANFINADITVLGERSGNGNGEIGLNIASNRTASDRPLYLYINYSSDRSANLDKQFRAEIMQLASPPYSFDVEELSVTKHRGRYKIQVRPLESYAWTLNGVPSWCTIVDRQFSYSGTQNIIMEITENTGSSARSFQLGVGRLTVGGPDPNAIYINVTQRTDNGGFYVSPTQLSFSQSGGTKYYNIYGCDQFIENGNSRTDYYWMYRSTRGETDVYSTASGDRLAVTVPNRSIPVNTAMIGNAEIAIYSITSYSTIIDPWVPGIIGTIDPASASADVIISGPKVRWEDAYGPRFDVTWAQQR